MVLADRGVHKQNRSGLERLMPAMFAYDLPPSRRAPPTSNLLLPHACSDGVVPAHRAGHRAASIAFCRANRAQLELPALRGHPDGGVATSRHAEHPGSLHLSRRSALPPVTAGVGDRVHQPGGRRHLSRRDRPQAPASSTSPATSPRRFKKDLADGVIQQSLLHFSPQYVGNPPGLPDVVMFTDNGIVPPDAHASRHGTDRHATASCTSRSAPESRSTPARSSPGN